MGREFLDKLAENRFHYWFTFFSDSCVALFFLVYGVLHYHGEPLASIVALCSGFLLFGLIEYLMHRWFFHDARSPGYKNHVQHHDNPQALLALPWFISMIITIALWFALKEVMPVAPASFFTAMLSVGYIYYGLMHHVQHHYSLQTKVFQKSRAYHNIHHKLPQTNYGVTTTIWDHIFGTHYQAHRSRI
jgi:sterol desaturase/sphingolipid hydroxylase (fatty acid hydroxylase superfamily)